MPRYLLTLFIIINTISACGSGGGSSSASNPSIATLSAAPTYPTTVEPRRPIVAAADPAPTCAQATTGGNINITGRVTFDKVSIGNTPSLNYAAIINSPARGITVQALTNDSTIINSTSTDASGNYALTVPDNTAIRIFVVAELVRTGTPGWNFRVVDNTNQKLIYSAIAPASCTGVINEIRDLRAPSGWGGTSYTQSRVAGPFNIIDVVYEDIQLVLSANANMVFQPLNLNWSINNRATAGNKSTGNITTSHFDGAEIYILGAEDSDTDEYDDHVISHEWGHYFEFNFSRSDSVGGPHAIGNRLDLRLAFGEGFGNAISAMSTNNPVYTDTMGSTQLSGFNFNIESNNTTNAGWYSESSVHSILYDIYDSNDDGADTISLGFTPIYTTLVNQQNNSTYITSIFTFITGLKNNVNVANHNGINNIVTGQNINASGINESGSNETNSAGIENILPIFQNIDVNGSGLTNVCVTDNFINSSNDYNKLGANRFIHFTISTSGSYLIQVTNENIGVGGVTDPDIKLYNDGLIGSGISSTDDLEQTNASLSVGTYILDIYDYNLNLQTKTGPSCFTVTVTAN